MKSTVIEGERIILQDLNSKRIFRALITALNGNRVKAEWVTASWDALTNTTQYKDCLAEFDLVTLKQIGSNSYKWMGSP